MVKISRNKILLIIFFIAMALRVSCNVAREELVFKRPFLLVEPACDERTSSDSVWYIGAARAFLKGKGVVSMKTEVSSGSNVYIWDQKNHYPGWTDRKKIDEEYYAHKTNPPLYPLFLAL